MLDKLTRFVGPPFLAVASRAAGLMRREAPTSLFWSVYYPPNFGEWVGPYLFLKFTGREPYYRLPDNLSLQTVTCTAGSIMGMVRSNCVVWGSGIFDRQEPFPRPWRTHAVRGPYTRQRFLDLGYECPEVYGDPGILLPQVYQPSREKTHDLGIIPHFRDYPELLAAYGNRGIKVIDLRQGIEQVIDDIASCRYTVSSSLHGIITSHAYGIPCAWARFSGRVGGDGVKYLDYFAAAGVSEIAPLEVRPGVDCERLVEAARGAVLPNLEPLVEPLMRACPFLQPGRMPMPTTVVPLEQRVPSY